MRCGYGAPVSGGRTCPSDRCYWKPLAGSPQSPSPAISACDDDGSGTGSKSKRSQATHREGRPLPSQDFSEIASGEVETVLPAVDLSTASFTFEAWCNSIPRWCVNSRTGFGRFLRSTFSLQRDGPTAPHSALFPLPLPFFQTFAEGPNVSSRKERKLQALHKAVHVVVMALNYAYCAKSSPPAELLRRQPNDIQSKALQRVQVLLEACDHGEIISIVSSGRKNLQLVTRLQELALAAEKLGLSDPYLQVPRGKHVPVDNSKHPKLNPFSNLIPERLKLSGKGEWDVSSFIEPEFYMPFQEPQFIEVEAPVFRRGLPNFEVDAPSTVFKLFERWDELGLLQLHPKSAITTGESGRVKIFNAFKDAEWDRQIGDRRERNAWELPMPGPSRDLPVGPMIGRIVVPKDKALKVCVTDRSDYYHQIAVSSERSRTNIVWPPMKLSSFKGFGAYDTYCKEAALSGKRVDRTVFGDDLNGHRPDKLSVADETLVYGSFKSILQGDHLGVEFGISAHAGLLQAHGLLSSRSRLQSCSLIRPHVLHEGLVIDDYFGIAEVPLSSINNSKAPPSAAKEAFDVAKAAYAKERLAGSDQKDVIDKELATVVGAEIDSRLKNVEKGFLPIGAPSSKRLSLSWIAAKASALPCTSDALHSSLVGGLVSAFCFRKSTMAILAELFRVIPPDQLNVEKPQTWPLSRKAADELILSSVLLPIAVSDAKMPFHQWLYASDSSSTKGAFVQAKISASLAEPLWQSGDFNGGRVFLDPWEKQVLKETTAFEEEDWDALHEDHLPVDSPTRPLPLLFDFLEICGGSGVLSDEMSRRGFVVGPIIDLTYSKQYNVADMRVLEWLIHLVQSRKVKAIALEPPCTTFSAAAYPPVRSYQVPRGFNQKSSKVWLGNRLAFACLLLVLVASNSLVLALLETPRRSKMAWLDEWRRLLEYPNIEETYTASCSFGSQFQKEFRFMLANMKGASLCRPCTRNHKHVRIEGALTKGSAVYCPGLAQAMGELFEKHLRCLGKFTAKHAVQVEGLESPFVNELLRKAQWSEVSSWKWTGSSHINVLELSAAMQALKKAAMRGGGRVSLILDSNVALRVIAKGRSSAKSLMPLLRKIMAISLAFGLQVSVHFGPTRLNIADDPTRSVPLRTPVPGGLPDCHLEQDGLFNLAEMPRLKRWISNWVALFLGLAFRRNHGFASLALPYYRHRSVLPPVDFYHHILDFDSTLGFPGEGPPSKVLFVFRTWIFLALISLTFIRSHGMVPRHTEDAKRAATRAAAPLSSGRPVLPVTRTYREQLLEQFRDWLSHRGLQLKVMLANSHLNPEAVTDELIEYGKQMYLAGRPYNHFAETINAVTSVKPGLRKLVSGAWDVAVSWLREEPGDHHVACPYQVFLALLSLSILWGWPLVGGMIALSWGAICRAGEVLNAFRSDLILPRDVHFSNTGVFLRVKEPKTRFKGARHQVARVDYEDIVQLLDVAFSKIRADRKLWPFSGQLLRSRFKLLLRGLGLPTSKTSTYRPLDLGSLRAGGATFLLMQCEDSELVRRRGRWLAQRTMEIYLQEAGSTQFFPSLPSSLKERVLALAAAFPELLRKSQTLVATGIAPDAWHTIFSRMSTDGTNGKFSGAVARTAVKQQLAANKQSRRDAIKIEAEKEVRTTELDSCEHAPDAGGRSSFPPGPPRGNSLGQWPGLQSSSN